MGEERALLRKLPWVALRRLAGEGEENLRRQERFGRIVFFPHSLGCAGCREYADVLAREAGAFAHWDGRPVLVAPSGDEAEARVLAHSAATLGVLADLAGDVARSRAGVPPGSAAVLVADRFGDVWYGGDAGAGHALPDARELEEWLKYLGTMCPE